MSGSHTLASGEPADVKALLSWVSKYEGAEAFPVYDYIRLEVPSTDGADGVPGALNGVTVQWDIGDELILETPEGEENVTHPVASSAVHVRPGGTITVTSTGFEVSNPAPVIESNNEDGAL